MNNEGLRYWIEAQVQALNPESFVGQLSLFAGVIAAALLIAALIRQFSKTFPLERTVHGAPATVMTRAEVLPLGALKSTAATELTYRQQSALLDLSNRKKKKIVKTRPKKAYLTIEKAPSDPMFLPPFDTAVPYRDRIAMIGTHKDL